MFELMTLAVVTQTIIGTLKLINKREGDQNLKEKYKQRFTAKYVLQKLWFFCISWSYFHVDIFNEISENIN